MLCLHGYHGSAAVLRQQMAPLLASDVDDLEPVFVDAPSLAEGDFGWWHAGFRGWERTRDWVANVLRAGPRFDGVFGFSQGAALAGLVADLAEYSDDPALRLDFAVLVGGFAGPQPVRPVSIRSAHVIGRNDLVVAPDDSRALADRFVDPLLLDHQGGHVIPSDPRLLDRLRRFLRGTPLT
ncbi:hypothetical protein [Dactylosporangium sp. CA-092794]|uniref:hypothetical protein n=1 Tax=Dactylosporangium sp. CA-092794 TaxID=3239929 RepID=UPI003D90B81C